MPLYRITIAYDGTEYEGWQIQPGARTIQGELEAALARMAESPLRIVGAGRTDAGAHAEAQVAHFHLEREIPSRGLLLGLNSILPPDIRVREAELAPPGFHARYSARLKTYRYHLFLGPVASPFRVRFTHHHPHPLEREPMEKAAALLIGRRDFASFCAASASTRTTVRECTVSRFFDQGDELVYEISASGFLRHMVRNIAGTLLEVGRGRLPPEGIESLLAARDRRAAGPTAPAAGLHLIRVEYPPGDELI